MRNPTDDRDIERRSGCGRGRCRAPDSAGTALPRTARRRRLARIAAATTAVALACGGCMSVTRRPVMAGPLPPGDPAADESRRAQGAPEPPTGAIWTDSPAGTDPSTDWQPMVMEVCEERKLWPLWLSTGIGGIVLTGVGVGLFAYGTGQEEGGAFMGIGGTLFIPGVLLDLTALVSGIADIAIKPDCHTEPMDIDEM